MANRSFANLSSGLSSAILVMVSNLVLKGVARLGRLKGGSGVRPPNLKKLLKKNRLYFKEAGSKPCCFHGRPGSQKNGRTFKTMGRGYLGGLVRFFFGSGPPWGGALSGRCPAVRPRGRTTCPATCPAAVRPHRKAPKLSLGHRFWQRHRYDALCWNQLSSGKCMKMLACWPCYN